MRKLIGVFILIATASSVFAEDLKLPNFTFQSIDGGKIELNQFAGKTLLITNTASRCGFTGQYGGLQEIHDQYAKEGLVVLGVPSKDFRQELSFNEEVKQFCETNFNITFPMTEITKVVGRDAHPLYKWLLEKYNFRPRWNFNKVLISKNGIVVNTFGSTVGPKSKKLRSALIESFKK